GRTPGRDACEARHAAPRNGAVTCDVRHTTLKRRMTERLRRPHFGEDAPETEDGDGETRAAGRDPTVVSAHDSSAGGIDFDELGQPRWRWVTEHPGAGSLTTEDTFNY